MTKGINTENNLSITWLCQGGFLFQSDSLRVVFDPYLSNSLRSRGLERMTSLPLSIEELNPDIVCFTHDHADHFDEETVLPIYHSYPKCRFIGPSSTWKHFEKLGLDTDRFDLLHSGGTIEKTGLLLKATPAYHSDPDSIGLIIRMGGKVIYLSGDTEYKGSLASDIAFIAGELIDAVLICINGKLGNMNVDEALKMINSLRPEITIPMHYGLFSENTTDPHPFANALQSKGMKCILLTPGVAYDLLYNNES